MAWKPSPELELAVDEILRKSAEEFERKLREITEEWERDFLLHLPPPTDSVH